MKSNTIIETKEQLNTIKKNHSAIKAILQNIIYSKSTMTLIYVQNVSSFALVHFNFHKTDVSISIISV